MSKLITGALFSGLGDGAKFVKLDWVESQIEEKLGFRPFYGTINLRLDKASIDIVRKLKDNEGAKIIPPDPKFCIAKTFRAGEGGRRYCKKLWGLDRRLLNSSSLSGIC